VTRAALFAALLATAGQATAADEIPPPRPKGVPFVPPPAAPKAEDPAETVIKIIKNAKDITDRLAMSDAGTDTRKTQDDTLALIDSLLNRPDDPPPKSGDDKNDQKKPDDGSDKKDKQDKSDQKDMSDGQPKHGKDGMSEPKQGKGGGMSEPKDGQGPPKSGRRPRNAGQEPKGDQEPMEAGGKEPGKAEQSGKTPGVGDRSGTPEPPPKPTLPVDDDVAKDVWGHLPDKLRQQVTQYYREEFMPRYADLLKQYYSSLSDKAAKPEKK
jgi:hypothetical protein